MVSFWLLIIGYCILIFTYLGVKFWQQQGTEEEGVGECGFEVCWDWHDDKNLKLMECSNTQLTTQLKWPRSKRLISTEKKCQCYQLVIYNSKCLFWKISLLKVISDHQKHQRLLELVTLRNSNKEFQQMLSRKTEFIWRSEDFKRKNSRIWLTF